MNWPTRLLIAWLVVWLVMALSVSNQFWIGAIVVMGGAWLMRFAVRLWRSTGHRA